jgi:spore coat-associated protein N
VDGGGQATVVGEQGTGGRGGGAADGGPATARRAGTSSPPPDARTGADDTPPARRPKRTLGALALGLCAIGVAVGSGADFHAETANPSNTFSAGALSMDNSRNGAAILTATDMKPGGPTQTGLVDIKNTGSVDGNFRLSRDQLTSSDTTPANPSPFANKVDIWVVDCGAFSTVNGPYGAVDTTPTCGDADDHTLYNGTLANQNAAIDLGTFHPGDQHRYWFGTLLDETAGNEYAGDGASARFVFDALQTH